MLSVVSVMDQRHPWIDLRLVLPTFLSLSSEMILLSSFLNLRHFFKNKNTEHELPRHLIIAMNFALRVLQYNEDGWKTWKEGERLAEGNILIA